MPDDTSPALSPGVLCYVAGGFAWFTTQPLARQWGDDWDDAPYEHNAGTPYDWRADSDGAGCACYGMGGPVSYAGDRGDGRRAVCGEPGHVPRPPVPEWTLSRLAYDGPLETPGERADGNSRYSVRDINAGAVAWLAPSRWGAVPDGARAIPAGVTAAEFVALVQAAGGTVYAPLPPVTPALTLPAPPDGP